MRLYGWLAQRLACCGCFVGIVALPVATAGGWITWTVAT